MLSRESNHYSEVLDGSCWTEYNDCELSDDLGLSSMDEVSIKDFRIITTRTFDDSLRWSCTIGCGHKVARSLLGDPYFSWTVIFK